ncbi:unnamed protein product [Discosporangium mesarthrocarpum]
MAEFHNNDLALHKPTESAAGADSAYPDNTMEPSRPSGAVSIEEEEVIVSEPNGDGLSLGDIDDDEGPSRSAENLLPRDKLENGFRQARLLFASGWTSFTATVKEIEQSEAMGRVKQGSVIALEKSMDGLSKVGVRVAELTDQGVKVVGEKYQEAKPAMGRPAATPGARPNPYCDLIRWRDTVVEASGKGLEVVVENGKQGLVKVKEVQYTVQ